jgi:hypothetical protein
VESLTLYFKNTRNSDIFGNIFDILSDIDIIFDIHAIEWFEKYYFISLEIFNSRIFYEKWRA